MVPGVIEGNVKQFVRVSNGVVYVARLWGVCVIVSVS